MLSTYLGMTCTIVLHSPIKIVDSQSNLRVMIDPFAPGDFAEKRVLKLVKRFSGHCHAIKS